MVEIAESRTVEDLKTVLEDLSLADFRAEINGATFLMRLRASLLPQEGQVGFDEAVKIIGKWLQEHPLAATNDLNPAGLAHLSVFSTPDVWCREAVCNELFPRFEYNESCAMLSSERTLNPILEIISDNPNIRLSPTLALIIAFAAAAYHRTDETEIIHTVQDSMADHGNSSRLAKAALLNRTRGVARKQSTTSKFTPAGKMAVLISGQLRAPEIAIPKIRNAIDLEHADVYVSTWSNIGGTPIERARLTRRLEPDAVEWAREALTDSDLATISLADQNRREASANRLREQIAVMLGPVNDLRINLDDDSHVVFRKMNNHEKMHYHNAFWLRELGHEYFTRQYDSIIKIRPDSLIQPEQRINSQIDLPANGDINVDHPDWLFHPWGFGIGDQIIYGQARFMVSVLDIERGRSLSTRILTEIFGGMSAYRGHINVGIELWLQGGEPRPPHFKKRGLASPKLLTLEEVRTLAQQCKGKN